MKFPNLFIIWEPKCWTTILHYYLWKHKDIFMSVDKEPSFFCTDYSREAISHDKAFAKIWYRYDKLEDYLSIFNSDNWKIIRGEASVSYASSKEAAQNIFNFNKDAKIIYWIREPISLLQSNHWQQLKMQTEKENNFLKALFLEAERKTQKNIKPYKRPLSIFSHEKNINFSEHLERYLNVFPVEQIKVIIFEKFKENNQHTIDEITNFLWVDNMKIESKQVNIREFPKYPKLKAFFINNYKIRAMFQKLLPLFIRKKWWEFVNYIVPNIKSAPAKLTKNEREKLMKKYKPDVVKINNLLHKYNLIEKSVDLVNYRWYDKI